MENQGLCYNYDSSESSKISRKCRFELVVDGGTGIRLVLHQSLTQSTTEIYARFPYLCRFIDLKKIYKMMYPNFKSALTLGEMMKGNVMSS